PNLIPLPRSTVLSPSASLTGGVAFGASSDCPASLSAWSYSSCVITPFFSNRFSAGSAAGAGIATPRSQAVTTSAEIVERRMLLSPLLPNLVNLCPQKIPLSRIRHRQCAALAARRRRGWLLWQSSRSPFREKHI